MQVHGTVLFTAFFSLIGQFAKSHKNIPTWAINVALLLIGVGWYAGNHGWPEPGFAPVTDWIEAALLSGAALPGVASLIGTIVPQLKTDVR